MVDIKIDIQDTDCALCHSPFYDGDIICRTNSDRNYCRRCIGREAGFKDGERQYVMYYAENGMGRLVLETLAFSGLDSGIYVIRPIEDHLLLDCMKASSVSAQCFLESVDSKDYVLEKQDEKAVLLFPGAAVLNQYDFLDQREEYSTIISRFERFTNCSYIRFLISRDNQIIGLSNMHMLEIRSLHFEITGKMKMTPDIAQLEKQCKGDIGRCVQRFLERHAPQELLSYCQNRIQGQGRQLKAAVYQIYRYLQQVAGGEAFTALNWVLTAPSGSGKTEFYRAVRDFFAIHDIPIAVVQIDLSQITEEGFKGTNSSAIPKRILQENPKCNGIGICFLDEADKKCVPCYGARGGNINAAVQSNLLTMIEGSKMKVELDDDPYDFDSGQTMFVLMGAFQSIRHQKTRRETRKLGFLSDAAPSEEADAMNKTADDFYEDISLQDIIDFGMQEELAGRLSQVVNFHKLSREDMQELIQCKVKEISDEIGITLQLTESAEMELLDIAFGSLGVRRPMNLMRELAQNTVADVFFDSGFDNDKDKVVIDSLTSAHIERRNEKNGTAKRTAVQNSSP
ncbi:MAG: AAA family ATPase [Ruminococcus sp.]|nr:AAA family ATPase [Ruminococcus sp.]